MSSTDRHSREQLPLLPAGKGSTAAQGSGAQLLEPLISQRPPFSPEGDGKHGEGGFPVQERIGMIVSLL